MTTTVPLFVYGTLRAGESLSGLLPKGYRRYEGTVRGRLHYSPGTRGYPVLLPGDGTVKGEMLFVNLEAPDIQYVVIMEVASGYSMTWADVTEPNGDVTRALTFTWHPKDGAGERIEGDDWTERVEDRNECSECGRRYERERDAVECEWSHDEDDMNDAVDRILAQHGD